MNCWVWLKVVGSGEKLHIELLRYERIHQCDCGCKLDRDVASAIVCLNYALGAGTVLTDVDVEPLPKSSKRCGEFRQVQQMKRQKPPVV